MPRQQLATMAARKSAPGSGGVKKESYHKDSDDIDWKERYYQAKAELKYLKSIEEQNLGRIQDLEMENKNLITDLNISHINQDSCRQDLLESQLENKKILDELTILKAEVNIILSKTNSDTLNEVLEKLNYYAKKSKLLEGRLKEYTE